MLLETRLLDPHQFWGKWVNHPWRYILLPALAARDPDRLADELGKAIAAEKESGQLADLLGHFPMDRPEFVDHNLQHLDHTAEAMTRRLGEHGAEFAARLAGGSESAITALDQHANDMQARFSLTAGEAVSAIGTHGDRIN